MPMVGVIDPSHDERSAHDDGRLPAWLSKEDVLQASLDGGPKWSPWPYELLKAGFDNHQERDYISVTMLTGGCGRGKVIERQADFIGDMDSMYASLKGTQIHRTLELAARPGAVAEHRFFTTLSVKGLDVELSCSPDTVVFEEPYTAIYDWKTTENPPTFGYPWKSHDRQLQYNRWLVNHAEKWVDQDGHPVDLPFNPWETAFKHLAIVYLGPKGPKVIEVTKTREVTTPNNKVVKRKMPYVWSDDEVLDDMMPRLEAMVRALDAYPEWPFEGEEAPGFEGPDGWGCPGKPWCSLPMCLAKRFPNGLTW